MYSVPAPESCGFALLADDDGGNLQAVVGCSSWYVVFLLFSLELVSPTVFTARTRIESAVHRGPEKWSAIKP